MIGKPVNKTIKKRYHAQKHRGSEGFGFYSPETNRLTHHAKEGRILALLRRSKADSEILFHHRFPTSTANVRNACHPFSTKDYFDHNYIIVHNGVIYNPEEVKAVHNERGIEYVSEQLDGSFNDSEALVFDVASYLEGKVDKLSVEGTMAMIAIQRNKKGKAVAVYFGRNSGNPLVMKHTDKNFILSSEGDGTLIDPDTMYRFDYKTGVVSRSPCRFPSSTTRYSYGDYQGYGAGYNWNPQDYLQGDDEIDDYNARYNITPSSTRRYFENEDYREENKVMAERLRLMNQAGYIRDEAIEIGDYELGVLQDRRSALDSKIDIETITNEEFEEYYVVDDKIYYLKLAVQKLRGEVSGNSQMGFLHTPDHSSMHRHRANEGESVDPDTGYAYYPFAS